MSFVSQVSPLDNERAAIVAQKLADLGGGDQ